MPRHGMPPWFPFGAEVVTDYQIPDLPIVPVDDMPTEMLAYDKIGKATERGCVQHSGVRVGADLSPRRVVAE